MKALVTSALAAVFCVGATASFAQAPEPVHVTKTQSVSATVKSIDQNKRLVELTDGKETTTIQVPPEVRNLSQVKVGDHVVVSYHEGLAAEFKKKGESQTVGVLDTTSATARMPEGGQPGAAVGNKVRTTVVIQGVDKATNSVTFTGPAGMTRTVEVQDPKAQKFISSLKQGDEVELTYTEALAVTVEPK